MVQPFEEQLTIVGPQAPLSIEQVKPTRFGKFKTKILNAKEKYYENAEHNFEYGVLASKFILLITLLVVSFINANGVLIGEHPREFLTEAVTVGSTTALATAVIGISRFADTATILNAMFIAFLVFFIFHVLMEFSGMNLEESRVEPKEPDGPNLTEEDKLYLQLWNYLLSRERINTDNTTKVWLCSIPLSANS